MKRVLLLLALFFSSPLVFADEEDWYAYWSIGMVQHYYPGNIGSFLDSVESLPGVARTEIGFDVLGFYWPQSEHRLLGFIVSGSADSFASSTADVQINQYLYGVSGMQFFGREIGDGFFVRGDVGLARIVVVDNVSVAAASDIGFGYLLGAGYALPVSRESRILLSVNFSDKQVKGDSWKAMTFTIGGLW